MNDAPSFDKIVVGSTYQCEACVTQEDVTTFAKLSGDFNPIHLDENYAEKTIFGGCIIHGMLCGALISKVLGTVFPGKGSVYRSQTLKFLKPIRPGEAIKMEFKVISKCITTSVVSIESKLGTGAAPCAVIGVSELIVPTRK